MRVLTCLQGYRCTEQSYYCIEFVVACGGLYSVQRSLHLLQSSATSPTVLWKQRSPMVNWPARPGQWLFWPGWLFWPLTVAPRFSSETPCRLYRGIVIVFCVAISQVRHSDRRYSDGRMRCGPIVVLNEEPYASLSSMSTRSWWFFWMSVRPCTCLAALQVVRRSGSQ